MYYHTAQAGRIFDQRVARAGRRLGFQTERQNNIKSRNQITLIMLDNNVETKRSGGRTRSVLALLAFYLAESLLLDRINFVLN